jgi:hypothetical protein
MNEKTLLEKAMEIERKGKREITDESFALALAWVDNKISFTQVSRVLGYNKCNGGTGTYSYLARVLKKAINENKIIADGVKGI